MPQRTTDTYNRYLRLLNDHEKQIQHFCILHSDSRFEACTLMQEVLEHVWLRFDSLDATSSPRQINRWLQHVMRSTFIDHLRHWRHHVVNTEPLEAAAGQEAPDNGEMELIDALLCHLNPQERQLVDDHLAGFTHAEIADHHHLTKNAVSQRLHRIVLKLKTIYKKYYE